MPKLILIADDEPKVLRILQMNLQSRGYTVAVASDGREALKLLDASRPDLIILDVVMPYATGFEVLEVIRSSPDTRDIPVIMATGKMAPEDIAQGWRKGADCYLTKPLEMSELLAFVERILHPEAETQA